MFGGRGEDGKEGLIQGRVSVAAATNPSVSNPFNATAGKKGRPLSPTLPTRTAGSRNDHATPHRERWEEERRREREREGGREGERERKREVDTDSHTFHAGRPAVTSPFIQ